MQIRRSLPFFAKSVDPPIFFFKSETTITSRKVNVNATVTSNFARIVSNGNRTEWSPIRSVIIRVITKSDDRAAGVRFVHREYDYRPNWTTRSLITN